ncbi:MULTISPECIES: hypothetical protein [Falsihalocynthiibacter]|uniref:hypothetical protein n=1 Tax=Falsihalocynthiibacter TaxID=2854182 RepID=UPI003002C392
MFRIGGFWARLSLTVLAVAVLNACVPNSTGTPDLKVVAPSEVSDLYPGTEGLRSELEQRLPYFPFGIQKTCGNTYPRLRLADVPGNPPQGNIALWDTTSKTAGKVRYVLWNEVRECGFLVETLAPDGEGPLIDEAYIALTNKTGSITVPLSNTIVDGMEFDRTTYSDAVPRDKTIMSGIYREKFLECHAQTKRSKDACRDSVQEWVNDNTVVLLIAVGDRREIARASLFMIDERLWWAGREIK